MNGRDRAIRWELDEAAVDLRFRFDPHNGIVLKAPDPDDQFSDQGPQGGGKRYHWSDKNTNYRVYDYQVNIVQRFRENVQPRPADLEQLTGLTRACSEEDGATRIAVIARSGARAGSASRELTHGENANAIDRLVLRRDCRGCVDCMRRN